MSSTNSWNKLFFAAVLLTAWDGTHGSCSGRRVLRGQKGVISDGTGQYSANAHCEWLIDAGGANKTIQLEFKNMSTECSFDFLFVYDGNSRSSRLLASLSGDSHPPPVIATSGYMLLYLFSDRNYMKEGFKANYIVLDCPLNCSGHGKCINQSCDCDADYTGMGCELKFCPDNCNGNGQCTRLSLTEARCECREGFTGRSCSLSTHDENGTGVWYMLDTTGFHPRTSHTGFFHAPSECLWIFGGFDLNDVLDDLLRYCMNERRWRGVKKSNQWPEASRGHAMAGIDEGIYVFGGSLANDSHSNQLWFFNLTSLEWTLKAANSSILPLAVTGHTLTTVENWIYLFGGKTEDRVFIDDIYRIDVSEASQWERVVVRGGNYPPKSLVGHTTVYYPEAKSLVVFGGYGQKNSVISHRTNELLMYHIEDNYWSSIDSSESNLGGKPTERALHSAVIVGNYLIVYGGHTHIHNTLEICFSSEFYFYHLGCHMWVNHTHFTGHSSPKTGRFGHVAVAAYGDIMFVVGGYSGRVHGDIFAYKVPVAIAHHQSTVNAGNTTFDHCQAYKNAHLCLDDPECISCQQGPFACFHRSRRDKCRGQGHNDLLSKCPGICPLLHSCGECASQGRGVNAVGQRSRLQITNEKCMWCVKEAVCQRQSDPQGTCKSGNNTKSGVRGWWGGRSLNLTTIEECVTDDFPAGLHWIKYRDPKNTTFPDEVSILRSSQAKLKFQYSFDKEIKRKFAYSALIVGYIHPLNAHVMPDKLLQLFLEIKKGEGTLYLSRGADVERKELVNNIGTGMMYNMTKVRRPDNTPVFPNVQRDVKYYMEQETIQTIIDIGSQNDKHNKYPDTSTTIEWNREMKRQSQIIDRIITYEFLEPYNNGSCSGHFNCLSCLTDTLCSWCLSTETCNKRNERSNTSACLDDSEPYLITTTEECPSCDYLVDCHTCASDPLCEWVSKDGQCTRQGRVKEAIKNAEKCNPPCHTQTTCSDCILGDEKCAWCRNTKTCMPFSDYVTRYLMGECTEWVDIDSEGNKCIDCASFNSCKTCTEQFGCGWCGNVENPTIGICLEGDFTGPEHSDNCSAIVSANHNVSASEAAEWMYDECMDVEECLLGLYDCHPNASCHNTFHSYECRCNQGFYDAGGGICEETCFHNCVHGNCSGPMSYQCICQIGWAGVDCNTNCGCHGHSTCENGVGVCDMCQHYTTGPNCSLCSSGSYGNPLDPKGCTPCDCNNHGDLARGECNNQTGECYCTDNTVGQSCDTCENGYYGDPSFGGKCYLECDGRMIRTGISRGAVGTHRGSGLKNQANIYCLWILTFFDTLDIPHLNRKILAPTIIISIEGDLEVDCGTDSVYVYDDIPDFVKGPRDAENVSNAVLLGAFCGMNPGTDLVVQANTGIIVIYFEADFTTSSKTRGFNASYQVIQCPMECKGHRVCVDAQCVCQPGFGGYFCEIELCPKNCSSHLGQGECSKEYGVCKCSPGFGGHACEIVIDESEPHLQLLSAPQRILDHRESLPTPRVGHTMTTCGGNDIYLFGGYSPEHHLLSDMWIYDMLTSKWTAVPSTDDEPVGRYFHAAACIPKRKIIYVFGGFVVDRSRPGLYKATNELWKFNLESNFWSREEVPNTVPPLAGHSLNQVRDTTLIVIGGFTTEQYFSDSVFEYNAEGKEDRWRMYGMWNLTGAIPIGLYGHSAVYHEASETIYVYGGYTYKYDSWYVSHDLYSYDVAATMWSLLVPEGNGEVSARVFHTAVDLLDSMMVIIGGQMLDGSRARHLLVYRYRCNTRHRVDFPRRDVNSEHDAAAIVGVRAVVNRGSIYLFGGFSGTAGGMMSRLTMPKDVCSLLDTNLCNSMPGCSLCSMIVEGKVNKSLCYSSKNEKPKWCMNDASQKLMCNNLWYNSTNCYRFTSCSQCLAVYPQFKHQSQKCKWCRNCPEGKCIRMDADCQDENKCNEKQHSIYSAKECIQYMCPYADCERCTSQGKCIWTRNFKRSSEVNRYWSNTPMFDWNCVAASLHQDKSNYSSIPPNSCTPRCHTFKTCDQCLASSGGEGGSKECIWSETLQECMPPAYRPIRCAYGECGFIIQRNNKALQRTARCPLPCGNYSKCSDCITAPGCGWCAYGDYNGLGMCMKGGLAGPSGGACLDDHRSETTRKTDITKRSQSNGASGMHKWAFEQCPAENECTNGHHTCNHATQNCIDTQNSFRCECKPGYMVIKEGKPCAPVCHQVCDHGQCVNPDECECYFGYVGSRCATKCNCNEHSNCLSADKPDVCLQCHNNTQGPKCGECMTNFVGNPKDGGKCIPCYEFCNNHTHICSQHSDVDTVYGGPNKVKPKCHMCQNNTQGDRCEDCIEGYFRLGDLPKSEKCTECQCNGHSNMCLASTGTNCLCQNNTESKCEKDSDNCWKIQCAECKEYFMGTPTNNHQCYRQMTVDKEYCFDPGTQNNCNREPMALSQGRTVFFAVQPKYLNVNIRITIDVTMGGVDVYFSNKENTFRVIVEKGTGIHAVEVDPLYEHALENFTHSRYKRSFRPSPPELQPFDFDERKANDLNTFITIFRQNTILLVKDVQFRLIITLPRDNHELRTSRFYLVLKSKGDGLHNVTYGSLYFRQDQPHIDLFVFFSVFFSCFFLFLAMCVMLWKMKQAFDARRTRQLRAREMECMASRPFAKVLLLVDYEHPFSMPAVMPKRTRATKTPRTVHQIETPIHIPTPRDEHLNIVPIAIEPTDDGVAAVGTVLVQLPGGNNAPSKLCLGSALTMRIVPPIVATKNTRRRASVSSC